LKKEGLFFFGRLPQQYGPIGKGKEKGSKNTASSAQWGHEIKTLIICKNVL